LSRSPGCTPQGARQPELLIDAAQHKHARHPPNAAPSNPTLNFLRATMEIERQERSSLMAGVALLN